MRHGKQCWWPTVGNPDGPAHAYAKHNANTDAAPVAPSQCAASQSANSMEVPVPKLQSPPLNVDAKPSKRPPQPPKPTNGEASVQAAQLPLREFVYNALLAVVADTRAPAAAKASACRTLLEWYGDERQAAKSPDEMTAGELDAEINRVSGGLAATPPRHGGK